MICKYCPQCGHILSPKVLDHKNRMTCAMCAFINFDNPVTAVGAFIVQNNKLLLVKRKYDPYKGFWTFPAGFMEYDETPQECIKREVSEETGLDVNVGPLVGAYLSTDDPRGNSVLLLYYCSVGPDFMLSAGDDACEASFFYKTELPSNIGFAAHNEALRDANELLWWM